MTKAEQIHEHIRNIEYEIDDLVGKVGDKTIAKDLETKVYNAVTKLHIAVSDVEDAIKEEGEE